MSKAFLIMLACSILAAAITIAHRATAEDFFQYPDAQGTLSYTDDMDRVPEAFRADTVKRSFADVAVATDPKFTPMPPKATLRQLHVESFVPTATPTPTPTKTYLVQRERRQFGDIHKEVYVLYVDGEERAVSRTPIYIYQELQ